MYLTDSENFTRKKFNKAVDFSLVIMNLPRFEYLLKGRLSWEHLKRLPRLTASNLSAGGRRETTPLSCVRHLKFQASADMLREGLLLAGFSRDRQNVSTKLNLERFQAEYGIGPKAFAAVFF